MVEYIRYDVKWGVEIYGMVSGAPWDSEEVSVGVGIVEESRAEPWELGIEG